MDNAKQDLIRRAADAQDAYHYALLLARDPRDTSRESSFDGRCSEYSGFRGNQKAINLAYDIISKYGMGVTPALPALNSKAGLALAAERIITSIRRDEERNGYDAYSGTVNATATPEPQPEPDGPQTCYSDEIATLREMLDEQRGILPLLEQKRAGGKRMASVVWAIAKCEQRIDALRTAIEALGGAL